MSAEPPPPSSIEILGPLALVCAFLFLLTGWLLFGAALLVLLPFTFLGFIAWVLKGPYSNPFDPD